MTSKSIYMKALKLIAATNQMYDVFEEIGITIDIDNADKPFSKQYMEMMQHPQDIACEALGLHGVEEEGHYGPDNMYPMTIYSQYPEDGDVEFSITDESIMDLLTKASTDAVCAGLVWKCFAEKDKNAKQTLKDTYKTYGFAQITS